MTAILFSIKSSLTIHMKPRTWEVNKCAPLSAADLAIASATLPIPPLTKHQVSCTPCHSPMIWCSNTYLQNTLLLKIASAYYTVIFFSFNILAVSRQNESRVCEAHSPRHCARATRNVAAVTNSWQVPIRPARDSNLRLPASDTNALPCKIHSAYRTLQ